jgi:hypothetical protein
MAGGCPCFGSGNPVAASRGVATKVKVPKKVLTAQEIEKEKAFRDVSYIVCVMG